MANYLDIFVILTGFEPVTSSLSRRRSKPTELKNHFFLLVSEPLSRRSVECDPDGIRTHDRLLRRQMLYPTELPDR